MSENTMEYKGYTASIHYSAVDNCLVGEVVGIKHIIGFHGDSIEEIKNEFKISIDTYLEACKELGIEPNAPPLDAPTVKVPLEAYIGLSQAAKATGQNVDDLVASAIRVVYPFIIAEKSTKPRKRAKAKAKV